MLKRNDSQFMKTIILASASPRRKELLLRFLPHFEVRPADCDESLPEGIAPFEAAESLARRKARAAAGQNPEAVVIGADTMVVLGQKILGKPKNEEDARAMLSMLSGRVHQVMTGVCVIDGEREECFVSCTQVEFYDLTPEDINAYLNTGEPMDKAGAYGIQGTGALLIKGIGGDYYNVVGLPLAETARLLVRMGAVDPQGIKERD